MTVILLPAAAVSDGALWQVDGGAGQNSGAVVTLPTGGDTISFAPLSGWNTPADQTITTTVGVTTTTTSLYAASATPGDGLILLTNGFGSIQHEAWPRSLIIGKKYTVTAVPNPRNVFSNWVGGTNLSYSVLNTSASCTFVVQKNLVLQANFVTNVFFAAQGAYRGLFAPTNSVRQQADSGSFWFNVTSSGAVSGNLTLGGQMVPLSGKFDPSGTARLLAKPSLTMALQLDFDNQSVTGTVSNGLFNAQLKGDLDVFDKSRLASEFAGQYTLILPGTNEPAVGPLGISYGTVRVDVSGHITLAGSLADGTAISQSTVVSQSGYWPLYLNLYGGKGSLWGWNYFTNHTLAFSPSLSWIKGAGAGFTNQQATLRGGLYLPGVKLPPRLVATLQGGDLPSTITVTNFSKNPNKLTLHTNTMTGVISGSFANPANPKQMIKVNGVILQDQIEAAGYFLGPNQSGVFILAP